MDRASEKRLMVVWLLLVGITMLSFWLGAEQTDTTLGAGVAYAALLIAAVKIHVILTEFMELRHAPKGLRVAMSAWLLLLFGGLMAIYGLKLDMPPV